MYDRNGNLKYDALSIGDYSRIIFKIISCTLGAATFIGVSAWIIVILANIYG